MALLEALALTKSFGPLLAVRDLSLSVAPGEVLGLLGPNGAGKSTTMRMLTGFLPPTSGSARVCDIDVAADRIGAARHFGYLPEGAPFYGEMTAPGFLRFIARARGLDAGPRSAAVAQAMARLGLEPVAEQPIDTLSKGFRRRVGLAQAILHEPDVLILDEPTDGLDPNQKKTVRSLIRALSPGKAIVISTHILEEVESLCSRVVVIDQGQIVADESPAALRARSLYAHAVTLTFAVEPPLSKLMHLGPIETERLPDGRQKLTIRSPERSPMLDAVQAALSQNRLEVLDIVVEAGRLDDVFLALTTHEDEAVVPADEVSP